ncbi:large ribosomal subunit protein mL52-like [Lineus longissimus]|uniref:large ribosomal subunit protein mL52-like n=1 Tax=Lineus longissimus TaxID=88925 RepID=UPI002B4EC3E5
MEISGIFQLLNDEIIISKMAASMFRVVPLVHSIIHHSVPTTRLFSTYQVKFAEKWRIKHGLPRHPNAHGPLVDLPDYTYLDGRPTPLTFGQRKRRDLQIDYSERIMKLLNEIDTTEKIYNEKMAEQKNVNKDIVRSKLKPKGGTAKS